MGNYQLGAVMGVAVVCADQSSRFFSDAKNTFLYVTGSENCDAICEEALEMRLKELHNGLARAGLPDTFHAFALGYVSRWAWHVSVVVFRRTGDTCWNLFMWHAWHHP